MTKGIHSQKRKWRTLNLVNLCVIIMVFCGAINKSAKATASQQKILEQLGKYSQVAGQWSLINGAIHTLNQECEQTLALPPHYAFAIDSGFRKNLNQSIGYFIEQVSGGKPLGDHALKAIQELKAPKACQKDFLDGSLALYTDMADSMVSFLAHAKPLSVLPPERASADKIKREFVNQLAHFDLLPEHAQLGLIQAHQYGRYRYTIASILHMPQDAKKAMALLKRTVQNTDSAKAHYVLGQMYDEDNQRDFALEHFHLAGEKGESHAQTWLGNYYACNANIKVAKKWLTDAKRTAQSPEYIDDLIAEIDELGMPTNCIDGWVY